MSAAPCSAGGDLQSLIERMREHRLNPLWQLYEQIVVPEPRATESSQHWSFNELRQLVAVAGSSVSGALADHRVLLLQNPALGSRIGTTSTLLAGVQCVMPGERTISHRHTAAAVRLVLESGGAATMVNGETKSMRSGDVVLTPSWAWHSHANHANTPAVWIDMLDVPLMGLLGTTFGARAENEPAPVPSSEEAYRHAGLTPVDSGVLPDCPRRLQWAWSEVVEALGHVAPSRDGSRSMRYVDPATGAAVTPTLDVCAREISRQQSTVRRRSVGTALCVVLDGEGRSRIGELEHEWSQHDLFTIPNWTWHTHRASTEVARLLVVSDREFHRRAGFLREETAEAS